VRSAPVAKLLYFYFSLHFALVFFAPVIGALAFRTGQFYKTVLGHKCKKLRGVYYIPKDLKRQEKTAGCNATCCV